MKKRGIISISIFLACLLAASTVLPGSAHAVSTRNHDPLTGIKGFPGWSIDTGWFGLSKYGITLKFRLGAGFGGTLASLDLRGSGNLDLTGKKLWFNGGSSSAAMDVGLQTWAEYWFKGLGIDRQDDLPGLDTFDWRFSHQVTVPSGKPYLLGTSIELVDPVEFEDVLGYSIDVIANRISMGVGLDLEATAHNTIAGRHLSTNRGTFSSSSEQKAVVMSKPTFNVGAITQTSRSSWTVDVTPKAAFSVEFSIFSYKFALPIATIPFNLGSFTFQTSPSRSITFCTGTYYRDADGDTYGVSGLTKVACSPPSGYAELEGDCNDGNDAIRPGAEELDNNIDDNCNGLTDEGVQLYTYCRDADGDTYGDPDLTQTGASPPGNPGDYVVNCEDCNDASAAVHPGATEVDNDLDDDCDGTPDDGIVNTYYQDSDNDGYGNPAVTTQALTQPAGYVANGDDCNDRRADVNPGHPEVCEDFRPVDNDCDGEINEGLGRLYYSDFDDDGFGNSDPAAFAIRVCKTCKPTDPLCFLGRVSANNLDCDDGNSAVNPRAREVCDNGVDDNCNGQTDELCNPPVAQNLEAVTDEDTDVSVLLSASDADGDALTFSFSQPAHGTLSGSNPALTYVPHADYYGQDSFTFRASDGTFDSNVATVKITVNPVNDPPVADAGIDQFLTVGPTCEAQATMDGSGSSDIEDDPLAYLWSWNDLSYSGQYAVITFSAGEHIASLVVNDGEYDSPPDGVTVTAIDETSPVLVPPGNVVAECTDPNGQPVDIGIGTETISDNCCVAGTTLVDPGVYYLGQTPVSWEATDCSGNATQATQYVTVEDTTPPALAPPVDLTVECTSPAGQSVPIGAATATDACSDTGTIAIGNDAPLLFPVGGTPVTWTATDAQLLSSTAEQYVTVADTTPPALTPPPDVAGIECTGQAGTSVEIGAATATDVCSDFVTIANDAPLLFPVGRTPVTWTATDAQLLSSAVVQTVTVEDTTAPALSVSVTPTVLWPPNHKLVEVYPVVETSDVCCEQVDVSYTVTVTEGDTENTFDPLYDVDPNSGYIGEDVQIVDGRIYLRAERAGSSLNGREYVITYMATDCNGNLSTAGATVLVPHDQR